MALLIISVQCLAYHRESCSRASSIVIGINKKWTRPLTIQKLPFSRLTTLYMSSRPIIWLSNLPNLQRESVLSNWSIHVVSSDYIFATRIGAKKYQNSHLLEVMKALVVIGAHNESTVKFGDRVGFKWFSNVSHSFNYGYLFSVLIIGFTVFQVIVWCILSLACHMSSKFHEHPRLPSSSVLMGLGLSKNMW